MFHVKHIPHPRFKYLELDVSRETMLLPLLNLNSKKIIIDIRCFT